MTTTIPVLKVVIAGDGNVGKTSLIRRYCEGKFEQSRVATIGVDFQTKLIELPGGQVKLSIWDMAGQERFQVMREGFYRGSLAAALVYDLTEPTSLENLVKWRREILKVVPNLPLLVVANKHDLAPNHSMVHGQMLADKINTRHVATSARTGDGVKGMFDRLAIMAAPKQFKTSPE